MKKHTLPTRAKVLRLIAFMTLVLISGFLNGCEEKEFRDYNTIVSVVLPFDCQNCSVELLKSLDYDTELSSPLRGKAGDEIDFTIDWEFARWLEPEKEDYTLGLKVKKSSGQGFSEVSWYEFVHATEFDFEVGKKYRWTPEDNSIQETGNTEEKVRESSNNGGSESADCMDVPAAKKYFDRISNPNGPGCQPCANCAALACAKARGNAQLIQLYESAVKQDEEYYGEKTCPELY